MFGKVSLGGRRQRPVPTGRIALAGVMVGAVLAVAFGTGYTTTKALGSDDSAWLQKGDTIVHVNGPSGRYDAVVADRPTSLAASVHDQLNIVETPGNQVYAADPATHKVYKIDLSTMEPQSVGSAGTSVLAAGSSHYVLNASNGTVTSFDPKTLTLSTPIRVPGGVASGSITPSGVAYVGSDDGSVTVIDKGKVKTAAVAPKNHPIDVSVVGGHPVAVDTSNGQLHDLSPSGPPKPTIALPGQAKATVQIAPSLAGSVGWLIRGTQLVEVNPTTGYSVGATLPRGDIFGAPLGNGSRGYVPDDTTNRVLVYNTVPDLIRQIAVPTGLPGRADIELVVKDGNVWADNPTSSEATVIHPDGSSQVVDKGTGNGVVAPGRGRPGGQRNTGGGARKLAKGSPEVPTQHRSTTPAGVASPPVVPAPAPGSQLPSPTPTEPAPLPLASPAVPVSPPVTAPTPVTIPPPALVTNRSLPSVPPTTTPTIPTQHGTPPPTQAPPTGAPGVRVPTGLEGKDITAACQILVAAKLLCAERDLGQAPAGQAPKVVTAVPKEGQTVPEQTSIEVDYYSTGAPIKVPDFAKGEDPQTYCSKIPAGLACTPTDLGKGNPEGQVVKTDPPVGTPVPYGSTVLADYYSGSSPIFVPTPGAPEPDGGNVPTNPQQYCTYADSLGFQCHAAADAVENDTDNVAGLADPGQKLNEAESSDIDPPPSSTVGQPYGTDLTVHYFDTQGQPVPNEDNKAKDTACSDYTTAGLACGTQSAVTATGTAPNSVVAGSEQAVVGGKPVPAANLVVAAKTVVNFNYAEGSTVPDVSGQDGTTACANIAAAGLTCSPDNQTGAYGSAPGVTSESPAAGTVVATGSAVTIDVNDPDPGVVVGNCVGAAPGTCSTPGITYVPQNDGVATPQCNVVLSQSVPAGTTVATGTSVTTDYDACYATVTISEWHVSVDNLGGEFHFLEAVNGNPNPSTLGVQGTWDGGEADMTRGLALVNGACPTGSVALYEASLQAPDAAPNDPSEAGLNHYAVSPGVAYGNPWTQGGPGTGPIACVFPPQNNACPTGTVAIYTHPIANPKGGNTVDWSWTENPEGSISWCELPPA